MLSVLEHGLRASEAVGLNIEGYDGERLHIKVAKADSIGTVPLTDKARAVLDAYLSWLMRNSFEVTPESPLFISLSPRNKGKRLGYHGLYKEFKKLAELCGIENAYPHRHRHTFATSLVLSGMDSAKARRLTRHKTERSFARCSQKALDAEKQNGSFASGLLKKRAESCLLLLLLRAEQLLRESLQYCRLSLNN